MKVLSSCHEAITNAINNTYFSIAHLYKEEKSRDMHIHNCFEMYYSISGDKQFLINNQHYDISPGDIFVLNQYESHCISKLQQEIHERIIIAISPEFIQLFSTPSTRLDECFDKHSPNFNHRCSLSPEQQKRFLYYINKISSAEGYGLDIIERCAFQELMLMLNLAYHDNSEILPSPSFQPNKQVNDILAYINLNIHQSITIQELAAYFYLSPSYICRIFKAATGTTIIKYITATRISIAKIHLANGASVTTTFLQSGFNDYSHFVRCFTKVVGIPPKKYAQLSYS